MSQESEKIDEATSRWHIDKRINIATVLTVGGLGISIFLWGADVNTKLAVNALIDQQQSEALKTIEETIGKLDERLDALDDGEPHYYYYPPPSVPQYPPYE